MEASRTTTVRLTLVQKRSSRTSFYVSFKLWSSIFGLTREERERDRVDKYAFVIQRIVSVDSFDAVEPRLALVVIAFDLAWDTWVEEGWHGKGGGEEWCNRCTRVERGRDTWPLRCSTILPAMAAREKSGCAPRPLQPSSSWKALEEKSCRGIELAEDVSVLGRIGQSQTFST